MGPIYLITYVDISKQFQLPESTVRRLVQEYNYGKIAPSPRSGRHRATTPKLIGQFTEWPQKMQIQGGQLLQTLPAILIIL